MYKVFVKVYIYDYNKFTEVLNMLFDTLYANMNFQDESEREKLNILFNGYMDNLPDNFYKDQFTLAKEIGGDYSDWVTLLSWDTFRAWKNEQIAIIASVKTDEALAGNESLANKETLPLLKVRQDILREEKSSDKPPMVILPESLFFSDKN